jgi:enamine deaminase RidA (YjgF/YER057c/UK114 family)
VNRKLRVHLLLTLLSIPLGLLATGAQSQTSAQKAATPNRVKKSSGDQTVRLFNPEGMAKPVSTYSHVAEVTGGKLVFVAGQVALDVDGKLVGRGDFRAQAEQAMKNVRRAVEAAGGTMSSVVKTNYYVAEAVDAKDMPALREVRDQYIDTKSPPTSTLVVVKRLASPDYLIEVEAVAAIK